MVASRTDRGIKLIHNKVIKAVSNDFAHVCNLLRIVGAHFASDLGITYWHVNLWFSLAAKKLPIESLLAPTSLILAAPPK